MKNKLINDVTRNVNSMIREEGEEVTPKLM